MDYIDLSVIVFLGNTMTLCFLWGMTQFKDVVRVKDASWMAIAAVGFPLFFALATMVTIGPLPASLASIVAQ